MVKWFIVSRRQPGQTRERVFYEWAIIHVALMLTTPTEMRKFRRYVQHFGIPGTDTKLPAHPLSNAQLVFPLSDEVWETVADHWLDKPEHIFDVLQSRDYVQRMQPHSFTDPNGFITELMEGEQLYAKDGFYSGGVKLFHFLRKRPDLSLDQFRNLLQDHAKVVLDAASAKGVVKKYVINWQLPMDNRNLRGSLFERAEVGAYAGIEELWFESLEDLIQLRIDPEIYGAIRPSADRLADAGSFSMVAKERVVYDYVTPGHLSPPPAVLDPSSLEAALDRQGYLDWGNVLAELPAPTLEP